MKRLLPFIFTIFLLILAGCSKTSEQCYSLSQVLLDGEEITGQSGEITIAEGGKGTIIFNNNVSELTWTENPFRIVINELQGTAIREQNGIVVNFDSIGLELKFLEKSDSSSISIDDGSSKTDYVGRLYYSNCEGNFTDYEMSSIGLYGTVSEDKIQLFNDAYSSILPMIYFEYDADNCVGGYVLSFPVNEFDAKITRTVENRSDVNNTEFIKPEEYIWNKYSDTDNNEKTEDLVDVMTITGSARNSDGGFSYTIIIIPQ